MKEEDIQELEPGEFHNLFEVLNHQCLMGRKAILLVTDQDFYNLGISVGIRIALRKWGKE